MLRARRASSSEHHEGSRDHHADKEAGVEDDGGRGIYRHQAERGQRVVIGGAGCGTHRPGDLGCMKCFPFQNIQVGIIGQATGVVVGFCTGG